MRTLFNIAVSSASGIEAITKREIIQLGVENAPAKNGRICFTGDLKKVAECNLFLRTANRVYICVAEFSAHSFDDLYENIFKIDWSEFLPHNAKIIVNAKCVLSKLMATSACQSIAKKAICNNLINAYKTNLSENGDRYIIEVSIYKNVVTVSMDTSGEGLHKRGYRGLVGEAPLKETLAAALILNSVWNVKRPFVDLFCGSGTFPIEAAMIAQNIPPGLNRDFDFCHWEKFDFSFFDEMKQQARAAMIEEPQARIYGFDIDPNQIKLAQKHAQLAGVSQYVHLQRADMREFSTKNKFGVFISNPPYGERLSGRKEVTRLYSDFGNLVKNYPDWSCFVLTSVADFEKWFKRKADKTRKIYNGKLECQYFSFLGEKPLNL